MGVRRRQAQRARDRLAHHLRVLRRARGLSQEELGARADLHRTYVGAIERSERNVSLDNVERLADALGVDVSKLLAPKTAVGQDS